MKKTERILASLNIALLATIVLLAVPNARVANVRAQDNARTIRRFENEAVKKYASGWRVFLVGVGEYDDARHFPSLAGPVNDVDALYRRFIELGVPADNITTIRSGARNTKAIPTQGNIEREYRKFVDSLGPNDLAIVYFSGHGANLPDKKRNGEEISYFIPADAESDDVTTYISIPETMDALADSDARYRLVLVDACRSALDTIVRGEGRADTTSINDKDVPDSVALLQSCSKGEISFDYPKEYGAEKHGVFTLAILEALNPDDCKAKLNEDGDLTFSAFFEFVEEETTRRASLEYEGATQRPRMTAREYRNFVVLPKVGKPVVGLEAGDRKVIFINDIECGFRYCPPGTFTMGKPKSEIIRNPYETQHEVTLTRGFWLLETETTQEQWQAVMGSNPSAVKTSKKLPVTDVSWNDCQDFVKKLNAADVAPDDWSFSLPTEAQWEYACRAGTKTPFYWGDSLNGDRANCNGKFPYGTEKKGDFVNKPKEVGSYKPNDWGLFDMSGNVSEWVLDGLREYTSKPITDPVGPTDGVKRCVRGGSYFNSAVVCRSAARDWCEPDRVFSNFGVRVALVTSKDQKDEPSAGDRLVVTIKGVDFKFRYCPKGKFLMGSPETEQTMDDDENEHTVKLTSPFWIMETETTQELWESVMGSNPSEMPVENVSWYDFQEFIKKLNETNLAFDGYEFALPTEAQWEYACRAGNTETRYGDLDKIAWYPGNSGGKTHNVATKEPNAWGVYDALGNVGEWCQDYYGDYPSGAVTDPTGAFVGTIRVYRGGDWGCLAIYCRAAFRSHGDASVRFNYRGGRLALVPTRQ